MKYEITTGVRQTALKVVVYGPEGIGKTTFASHFPQPLFIDTENSTNYLDVARFPRPQSWEEFLDMINDVKNHPENFGTLVIDTADWAERLCEGYVCKCNNVQSIEQIGYGKGYKMVEEVWGKALDLLDIVIDEGINVVITAHTMIRKFENPDDSGAYDRYELKLGNKAGGKCTALIKEWADMVLFANYKTVVVTDGNNKKKAAGGERVMYTSHRPYWDAKNRFGLKDELPFDYRCIEAVVERYGGHASADTATNQQEAKQVEKPKAASKTKQAPAKKQKAKQEAKQEAKANNGFPKESELQPVSEKQEQEINDLVDDGNKPSELCLQVIELAKKDGLNLDDLAAWAANSGALPKDGDSFIPVSKWPDGFVKDFILPNWSKVIDAVLNLPIPF